MRSVEEIIRLVCDYLNDSQVPYVIVGGFAVMYHGRPRATADIDLIISMEEDAIPSFVEFLKENNFFVDEHDIKQAFKEKGHCTIEDSETLFRLDIKGVYEYADRKALENRIPADLNGVRLYMSSAEDTILNKLTWSRERDLKDSLSIYVRRKAELDMNYLREEAEKRGVSGKLEELMEIAERYGSEEENHHV